MDIRYHRPNVPRGVGSIGIFVILLAIFDVFFHALWKPQVIPFVNGVNAPLLGEPHLGIGQAKLANRWVECKAVHSLSGGVDHHGA